MRPVRLTLQAFGPYPGRVIIDFRAAVEAGLFGSYGQTGSGKSTIANALMVKLMEPALMMVMAVVIGFLVVALLMPIFESNGMA